MRTRSPEEAILTQEDRGPVPVAPSNSLLERPPCGIDHSGDRVLYLRTDADHNADFLSHTVTAVPGTR